VVGAAQYQGVENGVEADRSVGTETRAKASARWGGASQSALPNAEALLQSAEVQKGVSVVARRKNVPKYRSVMDFLVAELFSSHGFRRACFRFYEGRGPRLMNLLQPGDTHKMDVVVCLALGFAAQIVETERALSWKGFEGQVIGFADNPTGELAGLDLSIPQLPGWRG